jgi:hypothetical protein
MGLKKKIGRDLLLAVLVCVVAGCAMSRVDLRADGYALTAAAFGQSEAEACAPAGAVATSSADGAFTTAGPCARAKGGKLSDIASDLFKAGISAALSYLTFGAASAIIP